MRNRLFLILYGILIFLFALYALKKPENNWDMLAYMAVVVQYDHSDVNFIHATVYETAKQKLPAATYTQLIDGGVPYRQKMAANADEFHQQMPFYTVKPLYTALAYLFYKAGASLVRATFLPSCIAYFLIGVLMIFWTKRYMHFFLALAISTLIMLSPMMWSIARYATPDCLSTLLLLSGMFLVLEEKSLATAFVFLLLSILARLDNAIPAFFILSLLFFSHKSKYKIPMKRYMLMSLVIGASYIGVTLFAQDGWGGFYYTSMIKSMNISHSISHEFHLKDYLDLSISQLMTGLFYSNLFLFLLLALILFVYRRPAHFRDLTFDQLFAGTIILLIATRFVLQPTISDRYYAAYYICIIILLIRSLSRLPIPHRNQIDANSPAHP